MSFEYSMIIYDFLDNVNKQIPKSDQDLFSVRFAVDHCFQGEWIGSLISFKGDKITSKHYRKFRE